MSEEPAKPNHKVKVPNALTVTQPGEEMLVTINRSPVGLFGVYSVISILVLATSVITFYVAPRFGQSTNGSIMILATLVFLVVLLGGIAFALALTRIYWGNCWVLTTDSLTQVTQTSLFDRKSSQLSLANLEDVSAAQTGAAQHLFKYGSLIAETAGEQSKFVFNYCPNPNYYAQQILAAREAFEQGRGFRAKHSKIDHTDLVYASQRPLDPNSVAPEASNNSGTRTKPSRHTNFLDPQEVSMQPLGDDEIPKYPPPPDYQP